jgi:hypothetical protein
MNDDEIIAHIRRRLAAPAMITLDEALRRVGITREELDAMRDEFDNNDQSASMENGTVIREDDDG